MRSARAVLLVFGVAAAMGGGGCSALFVTSPPSYYVPPSELNCTTIPVAPALDLIVAAAESIRTVMAISAPDTAYQGAKLSRPADISIGLGLVTVFAIS